MGEVYLSHDTRLNRDVAVKILPARMAFEEDRRRRFEQEARAASALNHPNIVSVYDLGQEGDTAFIVTEFVDGESLRDVIQHGPTAIRKTLDFAVQMADGLAAAHTAGIVHRDLKPENVVLRRDGRVKILDFGIAKTIAGSAQSNTTQSIASSTEPGAVLGTVAYMSPEQARGSKDLDGRSDQFSLGLILYELVTGRKPFDRPSAAETMTAIIHDEAAPLTSSVPIPFRWTVERCLAKEPADRYDSTHDLFVELRNLRDHAGLITTGLQSEVALGAAAKRWGTALWVGLVIVLALAAWVYVGSPIRPPHQPSFERLTYRRGDVSAARFSPDGQTVFYSAQWANEPMTIFSMRVGSRESRALDLPEGRMLAISSTGEMAILLVHGGAGGSGTLAHVPLSGGAPREILENVNDADWAPDGSQIAVSHTVGRKNRIEYPIGKVLYENEGRPPVSLRVSPKGDLLAFFEFDNAIADYAVTVLDLHGSKRVLSRGWRAEGGLAWSPRGDEIWFGGVKAGTHPALYGVTLSSKERIVVEAPAMLALDDIARDGRVLAVTADSRTGISFLSPATKQERDLSWFDASYIYDISSDGKTVLFVELSDGRPRNVAIYLRKTDGSPAVRLGEGNRPALSPDGKWVACILSDGPKTKLTLLPTGAGETQVIGLEGMHYERVEWFPDGQKLLFTGNESGRPPRTFIQDLGGAKPIPVTPEGIIAARISPDQKRVTLTAAGKLSLLPIAGGDPRLIANIETGESIVRWDADGRYLFLRKSVEPSVLKISRLDVSSGQKELWRELKTPDPVGVNILTVVMTPNGASFAYTFQRDIATLFLVGGLR